MILSIVVPVYNASSFLCRCVDSLLSQGLDEGEYEIILVNDGSKDRSLEICKEYQQRYPQIIKVFSQVNQGVSATRNKGIHEAKGEYLCFVDADDYLIPKGYRYLVDSFLEKQIDVLSFWALTLDKKTKANYVENYDVTGKICYETNGRDFLKHNVQTFVWNSFYRREYLKSNQLAFNTNMGIGEDCLFNINVYMKNPIIRGVSSRIYRYDLQENSIIHQRNRSAMRKAIGSYQNLLIEIQGYIDSNKEDLALCKGLKNIIKNQFTPFVSRILSSDYSASEMKALKDRLVQSNVLPIESNNIKDTVVNFIFNTPSLCSVYQFIYQRIFIPFILPCLSRN